MVNVKVCGVTNKEDAECAVSNGADYIGFIFAPSKRKIIKETALRIKKEIPDFDRYVGVFLNGKKKEIEEICEFAGIRIIQLHGDETPAFCNYFINRGYNVIKVFRVRDQRSFDAVRQYDKVDAFLFDTYKTGQYGGTGEAFDWSIIKRIPFVQGRDFFISGGLDQTNVSRVVSSLKPFGVDASSKLEIRPGYKDHEKVREFIAHAKGVGYDASH